MELFSIRIQRTFQLVSTDLAGIYHKANILIAQTYGITGVPEKGYVIVTVNNVRYIVYFYKIESGWNIEVEKSSIEATRSQRRTII